jgi:hypothetical protein
VQWAQTGWAFVFGAIAILFQLLIAFRMTKQTWNYVDIHRRLLSRNDISLSGKGQVSGT